MMQYLNWWMLSLPFIYSFASCNILTIVLTIADLLNTCRNSLRDFFIVTITINHPQMIFSFQIVFLSPSLSSSCHLFNFQLPSFLLIFFYLTTQCHSKKNRYKMYSLCSEVQQRGPTRNSWIEPKQWNLNYTPAHAVFPCLNWC